jgi:hypothetical protein
MLGHTPRKRQGITSVSIETDGTSSPLFTSLAPSDFFLFAHVKGKLMGYHAETPSELLVRIRVVLAEIPRETVNACFLEGIRRLQKYVRVDGEYVG